MPDRPQVVIITGGTAGIGRATVRAFAMQGAKIGIIARNCERLEKTKDEVEKIGGQAVTISADVANADQVENAAAEVERVLGPMDIWINNAMTSLVSPFIQVSPDEYERVTNVTYLGTVFGTLAALRRMIPRDHGTIVQVGSIPAYNNVLFQSAYCGAKYAVYGFTESIRAELKLGKSSIHITMVQLPFINTPQYEWTRSNLKYRVQPAPPVFQPETAADAILWAAHHKAREVYVGSSPIETLWRRKTGSLLPGMHRAGFGYQQLQTGEPDDPGRLNNLYEAVPGDYEAHGRFDNQAGRGRTELWLSKHKKQIAWGLAVAGFAGVIGSIAAGKNRKRAARGMDRAQGRAA